MTERQPEERPPRSQSALEWVIVGGGIHGVHLATRLLAETAVTAEQIRIVDPADRLLDSWRRCSSNTGMRHLRSPAVHHVDVSPWSLLAYAGANRRGKGVPKGLFVAPYERPALSLFNEHCDEVIAKYGLQSLHVCDRAERIELTDSGGARVALQSGATLQTQRIILATGSGQRPFWPDWARELRDAGRPIEHVFTPGFELDPADWPERVAVFGGGISAVQVAIRLAEAGCQAHLVSRHKLRKHQFDSDPGWVGPKYMKRFEKITDPNKRRTVIQEARHRGSVPPDVAGRLRRTVNRGALEAHWGRAYKVEVADDGIEIVYPDRRVSVDGALLATGFEAGRPGGRLVDELVECHALPCAACGFPVVDRSLRWHPSVFVTGPLAELELGPSARNITGARKAADRIIRMVRA